MDAKSLKQTLRCVRSELRLIINQIQSRIVSKKYYEAQSHAYAANSQARCQTSDSRPSKPADVDNQSQLHRGLCYNRRQFQTKQEINDTISTIYQDLPARSKTAYHIKKLPNPYR